MEGREVAALDVWTTVRGLGGALGRVLGVAGCVLAVPGCVLAADVGATTAGGGGGFCDLARPSPTAVPPAAITSRAAVPTAAASEPCDRRGAGSGGPTT